MPELRVGVPFPRVALEVLGCGGRGRGAPAGSRRTDPLGGAALAFGLVDEVVAAEELLPRAVDAARELATEIPPDTFAATKSQLRRVRRERVERYADEDDAVTTLWIRRATDGWTEEYLRSVTGT